MAIGLNTDNQIMLQKKKKRKEKKYMMVVYWFDSIFFHSPNYNRSFFIYAPQTIF